MAISGPFTSALVNPLATNEQLQYSSSQLDGVSLELENSVRFAACRLIQGAGVLLNLPQDVIAQAIVIYTRFWVSADGGSLKLDNAEDVAAAAIHLTAKVSADPQSPRRLMLVLAYLQTHPRSYLFPSSPPPDDAAYDMLLSEADYQDRRARCMQAEAKILRTLGYQLHVALPHTLCINYLQTLGAFQQGQGESVAAQAFAHLNGLLLSPQLVYLTHQPTSLAAAAVYLASRETGLKLPKVAWWEVFDITREELGFLVASMTSMTAFASAEEDAWRGRMPPLTAELLNRESD